MVVRSVYLDIAKGLAIILMVIGHTSLPDVLSRFIYAFHMPLFFISTGVITNWNKLSFPDFLQHKLHSLILPFSIYSAVVLLILHSIGEINIMNWLRNGWQGYALWFIPVLFFSVILARLIICDSGGAKKNKIIKYVLAGILLLSGAALKWYNLSLPWTLSTVPFASFLILLGSEFSEAKKLIEKDSNYWDIFLYCIVVIVISHFWRLDLAWNDILPIIPLSIGAIAGTLMIFRISVWIENHISWCSKILQAVGKETYIVVAFSQVIIVLINRFFDISSLLKYSLLIVLLITLKYLKDTINKVAKTKIL